MNLSEIKDLLLGNDPAFWTQLKFLTEQSAEFADLMFLSSLRKKRTLVVYAGLNLPASRYVWPSSVVAVCTLCTNC